MNTERADARARRATLWGVLGLIGSLGGSIADGITIVSRQGSRQLGTLQGASLRQLGVLLDAKTHEQLLLGHYLALASIPLGAAGVLYLAARIHPPKIRSLFLLAGLITYSWGTAYHATFGPVATALRMTRQAAGAQARASFEIGTFFEPLGYMAMGAAALVLGGFALLIGLRKTDYPRALAWASPLVLQLVMVLGARAVPDLLANLLLASALNASMAIFLALSLLLERRAHSP